MNGCFSSKIIGCTDEVVDVNVKLKNNIPYTKIRINIYKSDLKYIKICYVFIPADESNNVRYGDVLKGPERLILCAGNGV